MAVSSEFLSVKIVRLNSADVGVELKPRFESIKSAELNMSVRVAFSLTCQLLIYCSNASAS